MCQVWLAQRCQLLTSAVGVSHTKQSRGIYLRLSFEDLSNRMRTQFRQKLYYKCSPARFLFAVYNNVRTLVQSIEVPSVTTRW
jgi:hypothetical protein